MLGTRRANLCGTSLSEASDCSEFATLFLFGGSAGRPIRPAASSASDTATALSRSMLLALG
jgi:hypothetical protein